MEVLEGFPWSKINGCASAENKTMLEALAELLVKHAKAKNLTQTNQTAALLA